MAKDDPTLHALVGRAGLVFAYVCFAFALAMFAGAVYLLPLGFKARLFLGAAAALLTSMFAFLAVATHLVLRPRKTSPASVKDVGHKEGDVEVSADAKGSHRPR